MKKNILVLDDSQFMLTLIGDMLRKLNYDVTAVDDPAVACEKVGKTRYDMILTDMNMPGMDGLEFTRKVKASPGYKFVPIVMLSSEGSDENVARAKQAGVSTFLNKPPKEAQLQTLLQITLNKRRFPRIPVKLKVHFRRHEALGSYVEADTFNLSVGGLFMETGQPLEAGVKLQLKFTLPKNNLTLTCEGRVAWSNSPESPLRADHPPGMGVEFLDLKEEQQVQEFLSSGSWKK